MSKARARNLQSYADEARFFKEAALEVERAGFRNVTQRKSGSVKVIDAKCADGSRVSFWLKLGWSGVPFAAIQFGMFTGPSGSKKTNQEFVQYVENKGHQMKLRGLTHALLVHRGSFALALRTDDLVAAYAEQMARFPRLARNTKSPTLWFFDPRPGAEPALVDIVMRRAIPLDMLARHHGIGIGAEDEEARSRVAEVEARVAQAVFRFRVGERCRWRCVVTGSALLATLDAAHLPGKDWRRDNKGTDGVLLRADVHRLLDAGLASISDGIFELSEEARSEYGEYDGRLVT